MSMKHDITHFALVGITDRDTMRSYKKSIGEFIDWAKDNGITKTKDMKNRRVSIIDEYSKHLQSREYSSGTIHTMLAPVCKGLQVSMDQIDKPRRKAGDVTKRRIDTANLQGRREATQERFKRSVMLAEATGARRSELGRITYRDLQAVDESGYRCVAIKGGKGGKDTMQRLTPGQMALCNRFIREAGGNLDRHVLTQKELINHIDYHSIRAERAKEAYNIYSQRINAEGTKPIIDELVRRWNAFNPKDQITVSKDGTLACEPKSRAKNFIKTIQASNKPYMLRGDNRERALNEGRPVQYNRLALLATSVFDLSHWRVDVTVTNYML